MPRGGFGNLIALPLQHGPRQEGNSVFLDDDLVAFPDEQQWAYLASVKRIDALTVERIASDASRAGSVVGVRMAEMADDEDAAPWTRPPSGKARSPRITGPLPDRVSAVLAQRLFVAKAGLPSPLLNQIKRLAAFQNPEFYKKQSMRLSTALTPRVISCAEDLPQYVALPRGCRTDLEELLRGHGVALDVVDERVSGEPLALTLPRNTHAGSRSGGPRASRERQRRFRRPAWRRQDRHRHVPGRRACLQHVGPRAPATAARPVACAARALPRSRRQGDRPDRCRKAQPHRQDRRGDDPEPRAQGVRCGSRRQLRAGHRRRVPPPPGGLVRARAGGGEGALRRRADRDAAATRRTPPDHARCSLVRCASR